jgi:hypothetical protein
MTAEGSPEAELLEQIEDRKRRMRQEIGSGISSPTKRPRSPGISEWKSFEEEVENGMWSPTDEDVDRLVLIPHFKPRQLREHYGVRAGGRGSQNRDEHEKIVSAARKRAIIAYTRAFGRDVGPFPPERGECDELRKKVRKLAADVRVVEKQNEALNAHLALLRKAKETLECQAQCAVEAIKWEREQIETQRRRRPSIARARTMSPREMKDVIVHFPVSSLLAHGV